MALTTMRISTVTPRGGAVGTAVVVLGSGFGVTQGRVIIDPLGLQLLAAVTLWQDDRIDFTVPVGVLPDRFVTLLVEKFGATDSAKVFFWVPVTAPSSPAIDYQYPRFGGLADPDTDDPYTAQASDFNRIMDRIAAAVGGPAVSPVTADLDGGGTFELGASSVSPQFTATYGGSNPLTVATLEDDQANPVQDVLSVANPLTMPFTYVKSGIGDVVNFTLTADDGGTGPTQDIEQSTWLPRVFWGVGPAGSSSEAFIEALAGSALAASRLRMFTVTPGALEKIYYAYPDVFGAATFFVQNFEGGFLPSILVSVTNPYGVTLDYRLYESAIVGLGTVTVNVQ